MTLEKKKFQPVLPKSVSRAYELLHSGGFVSFPLTAEAERKIDSIVANITGTYFGEEVYISAEEKTVAYLYFLIKDHPFIDGNKRTACLVFSIACEINQLVPKLGKSNPTLDELAVFVEKIKEQDHHDVIRQIAALLFD